MDGREEIKENSDTKYQQDYKCLIIEMIQDIDNSNFLQFIYKLLTSFKKKWGI